MISAICIWAPTNWFSVYVKYRWISLLFIGIIFPLLFHIAFDSPILSLFIVVTQFHIAVFITLNDLFLTSTLFSVIPIYFANSRLTKVKPIHFRKLLWNRWHHAVAIVLTLRNRRDLAMGYSRCSSSTDMVNTSALCYLCQSTSQSFSHIYNDTFAGQLSSVSWAFPSDTSEFELAYSLRWRIPYLCFAPTLKLNIFMYCASSSELQYLSTCRGSYLEFNSGL
jgi:hypothetical protein